MLATDQRSLAGKFEVHRAQESGRSCEIIQPFGKVASRGRLILGDNLGGVPYPYVRRPHH